MSFYYPQVAVTLRILLEEREVRKAEEGRQYVMTTLAKKVTVNINDYRQADTFSMELDYKSFPFDPRAIRALGVTIFMQDMKRAYNAAGEQMQISTTGEANVIFQGFADEDTINCDESNRTVSFSGRDFTSILIDTPYPEGTINMGKPVDVLIEQLVAKCPGARNKDGQGITVVKRPETLKMVNVGALYPVNATKKGKSWGANFTNPSRSVGGKRNIGKGQTFWDVIQDIIGNSGLIAFIEIDKLVITTPRNLYGTNRAEDKESVPNPYQFVYGRNIKTMKFTRKLSKEKGFNVVVRCMLPDGKKVIMAEIPKDASAAWSKEMGITKARVQVKKPVAPGTGKDNSNFDTSDAPVYSFSVPDVADKATLVEIGQSIFEEMSRQQIEGSLETKEMSVIQKDSPTDAQEREYDLLKLRNGSAVSIVLPMEDLESVPRGPYTIEHRTNFLISRGYAAETARALAITLDRYPITFYTKAVEFTIDQESGFSMKLDFINYIDLTRKV